MNIHFELCSNAEDRDELALCHGIALGYPADLTFADCIHRLIALDRSPRDLRGSELHRETMELPVFGLVAAKGGIRLKPAGMEGDCASSYEKAKCSDIRKGPFTLDVKAIRMEDFIEVLSSILGRVVIDRTWFQGMFDAI